MGAWGFRPLVTAWEMTAWRFSFSSSISRRCSATRRVESSPSRGQETPRSGLSHARWQALSDMIAMNSPTGVLATRLNRLEYRDGMDMWVRNNCATVRRLPVGDGPDAT